MSKSRDAVEDIRTIDTVTATANAALPKAGGALTGNLVATNVTASGVLSDPSGNVRAGRKNIFINGDFSVNQRGTGATTGGTYLTADRWKAGTTTLTFETVANDRDLSIANMLKVTSHTNGYGIIVQAAEDVRTTSGQNVTLSFWAKTANFSSFRLELQQNFGSGGSGTVTVVDNASYFSVPNTGWNQYTATIAMPSISGKTVGTSSYLNMVLGPNSGTSNGITYYSEVQLELGSVATDFEHRSYGEELALCQRYFSKSNNHETAPADGSDSQSISIVIDMASSLMRTGTIYFPTQMRVSPSVTRLKENGVGGGSSGQWAWFQSGVWTYGAFAPSNITNYGFSGHISSTNGTSDGRAYWMHINWKADAEL